MKLLAKVKGEAVHAFSTLDGTVYHALDGFFHFHHSSHVAEAVKAGIGDPQPEFIAPPADPVVAQAELEGSGEGKPAA